MVSTSCIFGIFVMMALIFSSPLYPFSRSIVYASPFALEDSLSEQQSDPAAGEGQQLIEGNETQRIMLEYTNPNIGISISYPENWDVDNLAGGRERSVSFFVYQGPDDPYGQYVDVYLNESQELLPYFQSPDMSVEEIAQQLVAFIQDTLVDFEHISTDPGQVAGLPAMAIHYTYSAPAIGATEAMEVIFRDGDRLYDFLYTAKPDFFNTELATFRKMIDSVQILQSSSLQQEQQQQPPLPP